MTIRWRLTHGTRMIAGNRMVPKRQADARADTPTFGHGPVYKAGWPRFKAPEMRFAVAWTTGITRS